jgi:macrodomain Ter protein organizer (MatP/YcbG family)
MRRFVEGIDRGQATLFPECLEDWIDADNPVRVIDAFVDKLDLSGLGFDGIAPIEAKGRFGKQDFVYLSDENVYRCPASEKLNYHYTNEEDGQKLRRYWTNACCDCALKPRCTTGKERRITRWEHEHMLEAVQKCLDKNPQAMRQRRETAEHPFGTLKMRMGATHFLMKRLPKVATEMALHVLAYNLTRVMNIMSTQPLMAAIRA